MSSFLRLASPVPKRAGRARQRIGHTTPRPLWTVRLSQALGAWWLTDPIRFKDHSGRPGIPRPTTRVRPTTCPTSVDGPHHVQPWIEIDRAIAPDGEELILRRRGHEFLILAGRHDLMSSEDARSSKALAELGCAHIQDRADARVLVGGLGMGYTLRAALDAVPRAPQCTVEVAELLPAVVQWNRTHLSALAGAPLDDPRTVVHVGGVRRRIDETPGHWDAILLDVDNGPDALAHRANEALYSRAGIAAARRALRPGGVFGVWSFSDDSKFTARLKRGGFKPETHRVAASRKGRGRHHFIWTARA